MENLTPILQVAYKILSEMTGKQGHVNAIAAQAVLINANMGMDAETFSSKLSSALAAQVKKKDALFTRVAGKKGADGKWQIVDMQELMKPDFDPELRVFGRSS